MLVPVVLARDELEANRLADLEELYQEGAAGQMEISRPTFGRLVAQARRKVADALFNGKELVLAGCTVALRDGSMFACATCGREWSHASKAPPESCCACDSEQASRAPAPLGDGPDTAGTEETGSGGADAGGCQQGGGSRGGGRGVPGVSTRRVRC